MPPKTDEPTDGNTSQWDKLKAMRSKRDGDAPEGTPAGGPAAATRDTGVITDPRVVEEAKRLREGGTAGGGAEAEVEAETPPPPAEPDVVADDDDDDETPEPEKVVVKEHERAKPAPKAPEEKAPPGHEFVEIDGKRVAVEASLAEAFRDSEKRKADAGKTAERDELVTAVVERITPLIPKPDPVATAAAKAIADAEAAAEPPLKHPMPSQKLAISDPDEYDKQLAAHIEEKTERKAAATIEKQQRAAQESQQQTAAEQAKAQEKWAREQLGIQFYKKFKVLDDVNVKPLVDVLLEKKFDEVIASGVLSKPGTPAEREALKERAFNDVAAAATAKIVNLRGNNTAAPAAPPPAPPSVATGASNRGARKPPAAPAAKPKEKFPTGTVSSWLKDHQDRKAGKKTA